VVETTAVVAGKKGKLLEATRTLIDQLEPAGADLMNVDELKKLFHNVDVLIGLARQLSERLDRIEDRMAEWERNKR
jgi:hypothetical protein